MKKTLYISDMDGTLLNLDGVMSAYTAATLNRFAENGGLFSIATGRSFPRARRLLSSISLNAPVCVSNGAAIYDPLSSSYVDVKTLPGGAIAEMRKLFSEYGATGFFYAIDGLDVSMLHLPLHLDIEREYVAERRDAYDGRVFRCGDISEIEDKSPYFCEVCGLWDTLHEMGKTLDKLPGIAVSIYRNVYSDSNCFMDISSDKASKAIGMRTIQKMTGATETVAFGDNFNDMPMLLEADRSYVTANGVDEAKAAATGVIGSCDADGVAKFLESDAPELAV